MHFREIRDTTSVEFKQALRVYSVSFPPISTRPADRIRNMIDSNGDYHLYVAAQNHFVVGISLLYVFHSLKVGLLDYLAVDSRFQRKGIGSRLLQYTVDRFLREISDPIGLLIELERERDCSREEQIVRRDRIKFYQRMGARILSDVFYLLPPQCGTNAEEMHLMLMPLRTICSLSKESVIRYIEAIYSEVYGYESRDLLDATISKLPNEIRVASIESTDETS